MISPKEQFDRAKSALASGKTETARTLFRELLAAHPNSAETHFHLGRLELQSGKPKKAKRHLAAALKLSPKEPAIWLSLMDAEISSGDKRAVSKLMRAAQSAKLMPTLMIQLKNKAATKNRQGVAKLVGITHEEFESARSAYMQGDFKSAHKRASALIIKAPKSAPLYAIQAASYAQLGDLRQAKHSYEKAISIDPKYFEAQLQLGQLLTGTGQLQEAGDHLLKAQTLANDSPFVHLSLGVLHNLLANNDKAIEHLEIARKSLPAEPRLLLHLAQSYQATARPENAEAALAKARTHPLGDAEKSLLIKTLADLGHIDEALKSLTDYSKKVDSKSSELLNLKVNIYLHAGDFKKMRVAVRKLVSLGLVDGRHLLAYARSGKITKEDPILHAMEKAHAEWDHSEDAWFNLAFALAKVYDDWKEYPKSFKLLRAANDAQYGQSLTSNTLKTHRFDMTRRLFDAGARDVENSVGAGLPLPRNIQITGMPRSGTTLVEQIISSHSKVTAAAELGIIDQEMDAILEPIDIEGRPVTSKDLDTFGEAVTGAYHRLFPTAEVVSDKAILSNFHAGILAKALPTSRMVVLKRDPRDNCLSIYKNKFQSGTHAYSTNLEALGHAYLQFLDVQAYWRENAPGAVYEIRYEDLVKDTDEEIRKLIDYCGLEWEDACLDFHLNTRRVKTLSAFQVRQKIYSSSAGAWKHYEEELQPLIKILDKGGALEGY